jgi:carbamoyl-phosphate synthase small subunit
LNTEALLALEDGTLFRGHAIGAEGCAVGEVVFNTAITGYQEILTDPSYARQMVTLTYPHIGNVGINDEDVESGGLHASGLIVRDVSQRHSNWRSQGGLSDYLKTHQVVGIAGIDTRKLTRILRDKGAQRGCILAGSLLDAERAVAEALAFPGLKGMDLAREVTTAKSYSFHQGSWHLGSGYGLAPKGPYHVVAYDFGIKFNILRLLADRGCRLTVVPATTPAKDVLALNPDGVFLSNGPGDPEPCVYAIEAIRQILEAQIPVFGICLGHQLLGLASGAKTLKMKFGHHGANHPVLEIATGRVLITSQNHGFAIDEATLPPSVRATHRSLFDGSLQGIERTDCLAFSVQGHPEASPGPHDLMPLFDRFITNMSSVRH